MKKMLLTCVVGLWMAGCGSVPEHHSPPYVHPDTISRPDLTRLPDVSGISVDFPLSLDSEGYFIFEPGRLTSFAHEYKGRGSGPLTLHIPEWAAYAPGVLDAKQLLRSLGVVDSNFHIQTYAAWGNPLAKSFLTYQTYEVVPEYCSADIDNFAESRTDFKPQNFGCSVRSNIGAMVANPTDFVHAAPNVGLPSRRASGLMENYYEGEIDEAPAGGFIQ